MGIERVMETERKPRDYELNSRIAENRSDIQ